jgi:hypothetical protein
MSEMVGLIYDFFGNFIKKALRFAKQLLLWYNRAVISGIIKRLKAALKNAQLLFSIGVTTI